MFLLLGWVRKLTAVIGRHRGNPDRGAPAFFIEGRVCNHLLKTANSTWSGCHSSHDVTWQLTCFPQLARNSQSYWEQKVPVREKCLKRRLQGCGYSIRMSVLRDYRVIGRQRSFWGDFDNNKKTDLPAHAVCASWLPVQVFFWRSILFLVLSDLYSLTTSRNKCHAAGDDHQPCIAAEASLMGR